MKTKKIIITALATILGLTFLAGCNKNVKKTYTVTWKNYDGEVLEEDKDLEKGVMPTYDGETPMRYEDSSNYYLFKGWDQEIVAVEKDTTYTATYDAHVKESVAESWDTYVDSLPENINDGAILHAFCWTFNDIKDNLKYIAQAGFRSVQTSPVQTPKSSGSSWWAYYQPLSFSIAASSPLGTKEELEALCTEAETYGVSVIVDVVFNHMANIDEGVTEEDGTPSVSPAVAKYEPDIYNLRNDPDNPTFHHSSGSGETQGYPDLPDLNTAHPLVQERALSFLKECIDVGVDGFRFDAAKHIETPDDPNNASDFWPNTLGVAKTYYKAKTGKDLFAYGEILGSPSGRSIDNYTKYMKVTDDSYGGNVLSYIGGKKIDDVLSARYGKNTDVNNLVTWVESHDNFTTASTHVNNKRIDKAYAIVAGRKGNQGLFLARPDDAFSVGIMNDLEFKAERVGAVNRFHNRFVDADEYQGSRGQVYFNERIGENDEGALVVDLGTHERVQVIFSHLSTGVYCDQVTGKFVTVRNGFAEIEIDSSGIAVLTKTKNMPHPVIDISDRGDGFVDQKDIEVSVSDASTAWYQINNGEQHAFENSTQITIKEADAVSEYVQVKIHAENAYYSVEETYSYRVFNLIDGYFNVVNLNPKLYTDYDLWIWSWNVGANGHYHQNYTFQEGNLLIDTTNYAGFVIVIYEKGHEIPNMNKWDNSCVTQSVDISGKLLRKGYFDAGSLKV